MPSVLPLLAAASKSSAFGMYKAAAVLVCVFVALFIAMWALDTYRSGRKRSNGASDRDDTPTYPKLR